MYSLFGLILVSFLALTGFAQTAEVKALEAANAEQFQKTVKQISNYTTAGHEYQIKQLTQEQTRIANSIKSLEQDLAAANEAYTKQPTRGNSLYADNIREKIKKSQADLDNNRVAIRAHESQLTLKNFKANSQIEILGMKLDAQLLLASSADLEANLNGKKIDLKELESKLKNTLLGEYTKYVADSSIKKALNGQTNVCAAIGSCKDTKDSNKQMSDMKKRIESFEQWQKSLKQSQPSNQDSQKPAGDGTWSI